MVTGWFDHEPEQVGAVQVQNVPDLFDEASRFIAHVNPNYLVPRSESAVDVKPGESRSCCLLVAGIRRDYKLQTD